MQCLICRSSTIRFYDKKLKIDTYRCKHCELIFKSPITHQSMQKQKDRYDLHENDDNSEGYRAYFQRFLDFTLPLVGNPQNALDFGCGRSTLLASMLEEQRVPCDSYDPLYHPDTTYDSKKYELIVSTEVFEHLHSPIDEFALLLDRLYDNGFLAIQTQFHDNSIEKYQEWYYRLDPTHIVFFTAKTFELLCNAHGCECVGDNGKNMIVIKKGQ